MRLRLLAGCVIGCLMGGVAVAQDKAFTPRKDVAEIPSYELVSVHPHKEAATNAGMGINNTPDGWRAGGQSLKSLIGEAYGFQLGLLNDQQLEGLPEWGKSKLFDVTAKVDADDVEKLKAIDKADTMMATIHELATRTPSARMVMLQRLLEERFKLKVHYVQRVMPLYEVTVAKGGVKMKTAHPKNPEEGNMMFDPNHMTGDNVPISFISAILAMKVEKPVEDKTDATGSYDFDVHWSRLGEVDAAETGSEDANAPSFFTAIEEQMGLKLKASKGPVWVIVVDHAELPDEN
jgi:uncharacterized protein (TIGR03435 family)